MNIVLIFIIVYGGFIFWKGQKEGFPNVNFNTVLVNTPYIGASPWEIEKLVTRKIEDAIEAVDGKKSLISISEEGVSIVIFEVEPEDRSSYERDSK